MDTTDTIGPFPAPNEMVRQFLAQIGRKGGAAGRGSKKPRKARTEYGTVWGRPRKGKTGQLAAPIPAQSPEAIPTPGSDNNNAS